MRPSVAELLSWEPAALTTAGDTLLAQAGTLQHAEGGLIGVGAGLSAAWSGQAADAATAHTARRAREVEQLAETFHAAGLLLQRAGESLFAAQMELRAVLLDAAAAYCAVVDDGSVHPPPLPVAVGGAGDSSGAVLSSNSWAVADALARRVQSALAAADAADDTCSCGLAALHVPAISPAPRPVARGAVGGSWGDVQPGLAPTGAHIATIADNKAGSASNGRPDGFWHRVGDAAGSAAQHVGEAAGNTFDAGRDAMDGVANLGEYVLRNPTESLDLLGDGAWMTVGSLGMAMGVAGEAGGLALSASGIGAPIGVPAAAVSASVVAAGAIAALHGARQFSEDLTRMNAEAHDAAAGSGAESGPAAQRAKLPPEVQKEVDEALGRAATGKIRFTGHDGKPCDNYRRELPAGERYTEWTVAGPETGRGPNRLILAGEPSRPSAIYFWDHKGPSVRIGP